MKTLRSHRRSHPILLYKHFTPHEFESTGSLKDKVIIITGASRGLGLSMGLRFAKDGAKIAILAKTVKPHPRLSGTIYTAAEAIEKAGGQALPIPCNLQYPDQIASAIEKVVKKWGRIDVLINNASALFVANTENTPMKRYDLITEVNVRGTFLMSKLCLPFLKLAPNPHILNVSPPLSSLQPKCFRGTPVNWFAPHVPESLSKYGMTLLVHGMSVQFHDYGIAVNTIWPHTGEATDAVKNVMGGRESIPRTRKPAIFGDAAYVIITSKSKLTTGQYFLDDEVLAATGVKDFSKYRMDPNCSEQDLGIDMMC